MSTTNTAANYRIYDRTGGGATTDITADSLEDAVEAGREWIEGGEWSSEDGTYRTINLPCCVREIVRAAWYVDIYCSGSPRDLRGPMTEAEARALCDGVEVDIEPYSGIIEQIADANSGADVELVEAWANDEGADDYRAIYRAAGPGVDGEIDDDATDDGDSHDCTGTYSDPLPGCDAEPGDDYDGNRDDEGHDWRTPFRLVGGIRDNPGVWGNGGTRYTSKYVCRCCGKYKTEHDAGSQRNPDEPLTTITITDRDEASEAWLKDKHEEDGWIPQWLAEYLDSLPTVHMSEEDAREYVADHTDEDVLDDEELEHAFGAIFGRRPTDKDRAEGLWSHLNA